MSDLIRYHTLWSRRAEGLGCIKGSRTTAGTVLMDASEFKSTEELMAAAEDKLEWNSLTNSLCPKVRKGRKNKTGIDVFV